MQSLRRRRTQMEEKHAEHTVIVRTPTGALGASMEVQAVRLLNLRRVSQVIGPDRAPVVAAEGINLTLGSHVAGILNRSGEVLGEFDGSVVLRASQEELLDIRTEVPGLKMFPATWAYLQYVRAMGEELATATIQVDPAKKSRKFEVRVVDQQGQPVSDVEVKALLDLDNGANTAAKTNADGIAKIVVPVLYPRVELILVEPVHTYWAAFVGGFARTEAPKRVDVALRPLLPDGFQLLEQYAPYDPHAGSGVMVGVIDSGVGPHDDLVLAGGRCLVTGEDPAAFEDNGIGHGTHVAGIIAARRSENARVAGIAPACTLFSYRVCPKVGERGRAQSVDIAAALEQAIADQCHLINISLGSVEAMPELPDLLPKARDAGIVVIVATGNDGSSEIRYPARYSHSQAVGALGRDKSFPDDSPELFNESEIRTGKEFLAQFSNHGMATDFVGTGVAVLSTFPNNLYAMMSGTSMATPFITGMAARLLSAHQNVRDMPRDAARTDAIIKLLTRNTRKLGWEPEYEGSGILR